MKRSCGTRIILFVLFVFGMAASPVIAADESPESASSLFSIFSQGTASGKFRTLFFKREFDRTVDDWQTLGIGGQLKFETASFKGFSMGAGFKAGQGAQLNSDDYGVYIGVLPKDADGNADDYSALDEYFLRYQGMDTTVTLGAQALNTPDMDGHYIRLTEKKYRGLGISNKSLENIEFQAYYITDFIGWTDEEFQSITSGFTGDENDDEGAYIGGIIWRPGSVKLQIWDYYYPEVMNRYVLQANYTRKTIGDARLKFNLQYLGMNDVGDALAGEIDTYCLVGSVGILNYKGFSLTGILGTNGDDSFAIPFGGSRLRAITKNHG